MTTDPQPTVEERVARHLAAKEWLTTDDGWDTATPSFRADYLAHAREVIALVQPAASVPPPAPTDQAALVEGPQTVSHNANVSIARHDRAAAGHSPRAAEAELYVLLRKAGENRHEAQALIDRHRDEVLRRMAVEAPAPNRAGGETQPGSTPEVVAYRDPNSPRTLLCRYHGERWQGVVPVTAEELPDGGICTFGRLSSLECGRDVLIRQQPAKEA